MGTLLNPGCCANDCDDERGKRGKRGHRGHDGATGPTGPAGPGITHVEDTTSFVALVNGQSTTVLTCPPIQAPVGDFYQFTGMVTYNCTGATADDSPPATIQLMQDAGTPDELTLAVVAVTPGAHLRGGVYDFFSTVPVAWWSIADGLQHVFSVRIIVDFTGAGGSKQAQTCALFVNVIPTP